MPSGAHNGQMKVWRVRSGQCLRRIDRAHAQGITSVAFSKDGTHVLSASFDGVVRVHGLKSGKTLKEFRGHTSFVNYAVYSADGSQVISASSDSTVRVWDAKSCECVRAFRCGPQVVSVHADRQKSIRANPNGELPLCAHPWEQTSSSFSNGHELMCV